MTADTDTVRHKSRGPFNQLTKPYYKRIAVTTTIESDAPAEELEALHAHVVKTSPVGHTLTKPVELDVKLATR